ncbi:MAG: hypothetical protein J4469_00145 [Candidatus Aenigmarchaeota archaeon]|nr:hypothetical protein [Candidatus Aenigmarchaeota archaeon]
MDIKPLKSRDQFFLQDEELLDFEVQLAKLGGKDTVLEIGAGAGNLTRKIAAHCNAIAIEIDERFLPELGKISNTKVMHNDAMKVLADKRNGKIQIPFNKIISNIPYSISQDLLVELLRHSWESAVLCVQREFAEKLQAKGKLAVAVNDCCGLRYMANVPAEAFYPKAVNSSIIMLKQKKLLDYNFWQFLGILYSKKNKNVRNIIKDAPKELAKKKVHQLTTEELKETFQKYRKNKTQRHIP